MARKMWRTLEPYHGLIYFAPEAGAAYEALGIHGFGGYFASRSAAMGAVPAEVVIATFFNFHPDVVRQAIPSAWEVTTPADLLAARLDAIDRALRRVVGGGLEGGDVERAGSLARTAALACSAPGRPLFGAHASLAWPEEPHLVLWHAVTLLREFRGDGHVACLLEAELNGIDALVMHAASGDVPRAALQTTRGWSDDEWAAAEEGLRGRGLLDGAGALTDAGVALHEHVERRTDGLAMAPWVALGEAACDDLRHLVRPLSKAIAQSDTFGFDASR